jgi:hypothetical protein
VLGSLWFHYVEALVYVGMIALVAATLWSARDARLRAFRGGFRLDRYGRLGNR